MLKLTTRTARVASLCAQQNAIGCSRARGGFTSLTHSCELPGPQWGTDVKSRAVLAVFTEVRDRADREISLGAHFELAVRRLTGVNTDRLTGALRRLTPIYAALRLDAVENDAARAAQAQKPRTLFIQNSSAQTRARPAPQPFSRRAATAPAAHSFSARAFAPATERELAAGTSHAQAKR